MWKIPIFLWCENSKHELWEENPFQWEVLLLVWDEYMKSPNNK